MPPPEQSGGISVATYTGNLRAPAIGDMFHRQHRRARAQCFDQRRVLGIKAAGAINDRRIMLFGLVSHGFDSRRTHLLRLLRRNLGLTAAQ